MADWTIGGHGGTRVTLKNPANSVPVLNAVGSTQTSLAGANTRQTVARKWTMTWTWQYIDDDTYADILEWWDGTHGNGPFDVTDPTVKAGAVLVVNLDSFAANPGPYLGRWSPELAMTEV